MIDDDELTHRTIGCFRWVYNEFGYGFLESGYAERSFALAQSEA